MYNTKTIIIAIASIAVFGLTLNACAYDGMGMMGGGWGHHGRGWHHSGYYDTDDNYQISKEQYEQLEQKREAFLKDTETLRTNLYEKDRELQNELAKDEPDATKAADLQKNISDLQAQLDQKRINHMVEMRKLAPNAGRGFMGGGHMMGYGNNGGHMRGYGNGYCWR